VPNVRFPALQRAASGSGLVEGCVLGLEVRGEARMSFAFIRSRSSRREALRQRPIPLFVSLLLNISTDSPPPASTTLLILYPIMQCPHGGSNGKKGPRRWEQSTPLYHPSIYTYTCRGGFFLSSEDHGSEGTCRGLRTRLELLTDMETDTRDGAIKNFTYMTDYELDEDDANSLNQKTKSILISPALIYKDKPVKENTDKSADASVILPSSQLPEEELIKRQQWSCYGSTEVEVLVLKDDKSGSEHVAAVAPRNVGISVRKIEADEGSITSIGVGWLNIVVDAGPSFIEDDPSAQQQKPIPDGRENRVQKHHNDSGISPSSSVPEEVPPRPAPGTISRARESLGKFYDFSGKVGAQMRSNVSWICENVQDDFPARSYAAGQKIAANVPKTLDKTANFMSKMIRRWSGEDDHDGEP